MDEVEETKKEVQTKVNQHRLFHAHTRTSLQSTGIFTRTHAQPYKAHGFSRSHTRTTLQSTGIFTRTQSTGIFTHTHTHLTKHRDFHTHTHTRTTLQSTGIFTRTRMHARTHSLPDSRITTHLLASIPCNSREP